ncbi:MAG TPA: DUF5946 family protein [Gemmatimonadaceae bacterium]|nr:DUF5946 family protein [Gemmatimonadaceae bacterium]
MHTSHSCPECGARYTNADDSCAARFDALLALDHSRREPWGSRHGQAFAAFALQHPATHPKSLDSAWEALYRIYCLNERPALVFADLRAHRAKRSSGVEVPPRPTEGAKSPTVTIADLTDFAAATYAERLDAWYRSALVAWGANVPSHAWDQD